MSINPALFSSKTDLWYTPSDFFAKLDAEFNFDLDVCALPTNTKCETYYTPDEDGLTKDWHRDGKTAWMNPPYGKKIHKWVQKAYEESLKGATVVCLLPARTGTKFFSEYCLKKGEVRFVEGRLKFGGATNPAPFDSAVVIFGKNAKVGRTLTMKR
jgi:phage N-6-adenine-methyltransferase